MNPYREMKTEVLRNILAAYTASYGRSLTEEESLECKETINLISMELEYRNEQQVEQEMMLQNGNNSADSFMSGWF